MPLTIKVKKEIIEINKDELAPTSTILANPADGAAVMLIASEEWAKSESQAPIADVLSVAVSAGDPKGDGLVGSEAIKKALQFANLPIRAIDYFFILEISAAQAMAVSAELLSMGLTEADIGEKVNPIGGALGVGNTYGAAGVILTHDLLMHLKDMDKQIGLSLVCAEGGQAMAMIVERR